MLVPLQEHQTTRQHLGMHGVVGDQILQGLECLARSLNEDGGEMFDLRDERYPETKSGRVANHEVVGDTGGILGQRDTDTKNEAIEVRS